MSDFTAGMGVSVSLWGVSDPAMLTSSSVSWSLFFLTLSSSCFRHPKLLLPMTTGTSGLLCASGAILFYSTGRWLCVHI